jgi:hypothetical protein
MKDKHVHPVFILSRMPMPADRETRMYPPPGKWSVRAEKEEII